MGFLCLLLLCCAPARQAPEEPELRVGSPAPPFAIERFLRGEPRARLEPGRVYVIDFWTVWCGPCIAGIPHLSALQRELGPRGLTVIGVAPRPDEWGHDLAAIEALLARKGEQIAYSIALDAEGESEEGYQSVFRGKSIESWMGAARVGAVPIAFVVDREGYLAAIAPPLEIDGVVRACLDGSFERARAAESYRHLLAARAELAELDGLLDRSERELLPGNARLQPGSSSSSVRPATGARLEPGVPGERELALALSEELLAGPLWSDARYLGALAGRWFDAGPSSTELALALRAVRRADELMPAGEPGTLGLLARLCCLAGDTVAAERAQTRALELAEGELRAALEREYAAVRARSGAPPDELAAVEGLLALFEHTPLVGLGEHHRRQEVHDFLQALSAHPRFGEVVDDVVVEFGNAAYQDVVDRYVGIADAAGGDVAAAELCRAWRDTTQWLVWDSPLYQRFFERVRALNAGRPAEERVRIVLGDPPIRWAEVKSAQEYRRFAERDAHFAEVVEREVLAKDRRALLVTGSAHLERHGPLEGAPRTSPAAGALLAARNPGVLSVVWTLPADAELARGLGFERAPSFRDLADDPLRTQSFAALAPKGIQVLVDGKWKPMGEARWPAIGEMVEALLYLGDQNTQVDPDPALYLDAVYQAELRRRAPILEEVYGMEFLPSLEALLPQEPRRR